MAFFAQSGKLLGYMKWIFFFLIPLFLIADPQEELCLLFDVPSSGQPMLDAIREKWIQQGKERWFFDARYEELKSQAFPLFQKMGMVDEINPQKSHYDVVVITGSLLPTFQKRLKFLIKTGVTFDKIVFLTGDRPLHDSEKENLPDLKTEGEMIQWIYEQSEISKEPSSFFILAPMRGERRPNSLDTIKAWLEFEPNPKSCLIISSQPYVRYQGAIFERFLPFSFEMVGPAITGSPTVALMLDTLGREIYYKQGEIEWLQK